MIRTPWFVLLALLVTGCGSGSSTPASATSGSTPPASTAKLTKLGEEDVKVGTGPGAKAGDSLTMHYKGTLADGTVFDTNETAGKQPFTFALGEGSVIKGWDQGLVGMKKGGERKLSIPSALAYGNRAMGDKIQPNSDLYFDVTLDSIITQEDMRTLLIKDVKVGAGPKVKSGDTIVIDYTGTTNDGNKIDSTVDPGRKPFTFKVGSEAVCVGIDQGVIGMQKGGQRNLQIPAQYGPQMPGNSGMTHYDVTLREIKS